MKQFQFPQQQDYYKGKVRDVYSIADSWLVMIASNRISAFDVVLPKPIPYKGQVLTQIASKMLYATRDICPNWLVSTPLPNVSIGKRCNPFKIEMVIRGNLTGHAWRVYQQGIREICGVKMPDGMKENEFFPQPIITPTTKAAAGHDEDISADAIISQGLATATEWEQLSNYTHLLFE
ncbi:MAG: phosphoribosylaminoimidazolesuccinocarboxamide synthase, partial [Chitinophagaceae bacterium]